MSKLVLTVLITVGGLIGAYVPAIFGDSNPLSGWSIFWGTIGSFAGIWVWVKVRDYFE